MSNWLNLKAAIQSAVKANGNREITGQGLQNALLNIVNSLGQNATFAGVAIPTTAPGAPEGPVFYLAFTPGIYAHFGNVEIKDAAVLNLTSNGSWEVTPFSTGSPLVKDLGYMADADAFQFLSQPANIVVDSKCNAPVMFGWHNENGNSLVVSTASPEGAYQTLFSHASGSPANSYGGTATRTLTISADNTAQVSEWERLIPVQQTSTSGSSKEFVTHVVNTDKAVLTDMGFNASTTGVIVEKTDWKGSKRGISQFPMANSRQAGAIDASTYDRIQSAYSLASNNKSKLDALGNMSGDTKVTYDSNFHINKFTEAGVYVLESADRMRMDDGLPILNSGPGHNISFRLFVLNSSLPDNEDLGDVNKCVTQVLMLSNRTGGDGDTYIRTGRAKTYDLLQSTTSDKWEPWGKQQQNVELGLVSDSATYDLAEYIYLRSKAKISDKGLNDIVDNGIYSGLYIPSNYETSSNIDKYLRAFTLLVFSHYAVPIISSSTGAPTQYNITQIMFVGNSNETKSTRSTEKYKFLKYRSKTVYYDGTESDFSPWATPLEPEVLFFSYDDLDSVPTSILQSSQKQRIPAQTNSTDKRITLINTPLSPVRIDSLPIFPTGNSFNEKQEIYADNPRYYAVYLKGPAAPRLVYEYNAATATTVLDELEE